MKRFALGLLVIALFPIAVVITCLGLAYELVCKLGDKAEEAARQKNKETSADGKK